MIRKTNRKNNNVGFVPTTMINNQGEPMGLEKDGEVFIPHYDVDVLGVFVNTQVAK